jgi:preprotein translocase subunit SecA
LRLDIKGWLETDSTLSAELLKQRIQAAIDEFYHAKESAYGADVMRHLEKALMMQQLDSQWREHLAAMDYLRQGIHLRSYAQKNPKQEYKREAFELFTSMMDRIRHDTVSMLARVQVRNEAEIQAEEAERQKRLARALQLQHATPESLATEVMPTEGAQQDTSVAQFVRETPKVGRNEACPCGSGKKYKHCHGALLVSKVGRNEACPCGSGKKYKHCHGALVSEG